MSQLHIDVVTPKGMQFSGEAVSCTAPGLDGEFQVLKDHTAIVTQLVIGELRFDINGKSRWMATSGGYLEVQSNKISIIAETAEWAEDIEVERAQDAKSRASQRLEKASEQFDVPRAQLALARALNRIKVASYK